MKRKKSSSKKEVKSSKKLKVQIIEAEVSEYASIEKIEALLRLYFKKIGDSVSIYFRPTHEYLGSVSWDDVGKEELKKLVFMPRYEFYTYLYQRNIRLPEQNSIIINLDINSIKERESWFNDAWKMQSTHLLESIGIDIEETYESPPFIFIKETLYKTKRTTY